MQFHETYSYSSVHMLFSFRSNQNKSKISQFIWLIATWVVVLWRDIQHPVRNTMKIISHKYQSILIRNRNHSNGASAMCVPKVKTGGISALFKTEQNASTAGCCRRRRRRPRWWCDDRCRVATKSNLYVSKKSAKKVCIGRNNQWK